MLCDQCSIALLCLMSGDEQLQHDVIFCTVCATVFVYSKAGSNHQYHHFRCGNPQGVGQGLQQRIPGCSQCDSWRTGVGG